MSPATTFDEHVVVSLAKRRRFDPRALNALLKARELLALSLGLLLAKVRESADPIQSLMARVKELEVLLAQAHESLGPACFKDAMPTEHGQTAQKCTRNEKGPLSRPGVHPDDSAWIRLVAGAGFEPATFGL
jgi:hypothetical protein